MPRIDQLRQNTRMQTNSPVPIDDSNDDRRMGEAIAGFGAAAGQAAERILGYEKAKQNAKDAIEAQQAANEAERLDQDIKSDIVKKMPGTSGDFAVPEYDERYKKASEELMKKYESSSPIVQGKIKVALGNVQNRSRGQLYKDSQKQFLDYSGEKMGEFRNGGLANIQMDPTEENFASEREKYQKFLESSPALISSKEAFDKHMHEFDRDAAVMMIEGKMEKKEFQGARETVKRMGTLFDPEKQIQLTRRIDQERINNLHAQNAQLDRDEKTDNREKKKMYEAQTKAMMGMVEKAQASPQMAVELETRMSKLYASGRLDESHYNFLKNQVRDVKKSTDAQQALGVYQKLSDPDANPEEIRDDIIDQAGRGEIGAAKAAEMLRAVDAKRSKRQNDPVFKSKMKSSNDLMKSAFGRDTMNAFMAPGALKLRAQAEGERAKMIADGKDPGEATAIVIDRYLPKSQSLPFVRGIPAAEQETLDGIESGKIRWQSMKKTVSEDEYLAGLRLFKQRQDALKIEKTISDELSRAAKERNSKKQE